MTAFSLIFFFLNLSLHHPVLAFAEGLAQAGNYEAAITEYKRFICFSADSNATGEIWREIARLYQKQSDWSNAVKALNHALTFTSDESLGAELKIEMGITFLVAKNYSAAEIELLRVATFADAPAIRSRAYFFLGVCHLYQQNWDEAQKAFASAFESTTVECRLVNSIFSEENRPRKLSPELATWLSTFLPGAGQIYCGDWRNGLNALLVNGVFGYLLVSSIVNQQFANALITYLPLFQRYYFGNRNRAGEIAIARNEARGRRYCQYILNALVSQTEGKYPEKR